MAITKQRLHLALQYVTLWLGCGIFLCGTVMTEDGKWAVMVSGVVCLWVSNLLYSMLEMKERYIFFFFQAVLFVFLIGRPVIRVLRGAEYIRFTAEADQFALWALFLTLLCMRLGAALASQWQRRRCGKKAKDRQGDQTFQQSMRKSMEWVSLAAYGITALAMYAVALEKVISIDSYLELYTTFQSKLPYAVQTLAAMCRYALCFYLAALPKKREATVVLLTFIGSAVLDLIVGVRNPLILRALLALIYYIFRDTLDEPKKWIGKFEKTCLAIGIPAVIIAMGAFGIARGYEGKMENGLESMKAYLSEDALQGVTDFFYDQGTSYDTLSMTYMVKDDLPNKDGKIYTLGPFYDYIIHGTVGQKLFHSVDLGTRNSEQRAVCGWTLSHSIAYAYDRNEYLAGHGHGGSYLLDVYIDAGYPGIIVFSLLLGGILVAMTYLLKKGCFVRACVLVGLLELFFAPRGEALGWLAFLVYMQFWLIAGCICLAAALCAKSCLHRRKGEPICLKNAD